MEYSKSDEKSLAGIAHEVLRDISSRTPEVLKAHIKEICKTLEDEAPTPKKTNNPSAAENLKACASFASRFAKEIPHDRKFIQAMTAFAILGSPPQAAKYAVSIIMTTSDKKEILAKDLVRKCVNGFEYGGDGFLSRLAALSQLMLLAPNEVDEEIDAIIDIAIKGILLQVRTESSSDAESYIWSDTVGIECEAKCWALKILVNRIRSHPTPHSLSETATPVYDLLSTLIAQEGELSTEKNTPATHKPRLRLLAARLFLKLCTKKPHDTLLTPTNFNSLAIVAQDSEVQVRTGFLKRLQKYLTLQKLPQRFYAIPFLLAFEPNDELKSQITTWIRSRVIFFSSFKSQPANTKPAVIMESVFARLLSLLTHHPDYGPTPEDLIDFSRYIIFYLQNVATEDNVSLIYHIAQRLKQCRDAIAPRKHPTDLSNFDPNLYHLSDLAQLTIRKFEEAHSWIIQTLPAKIRLPTSLFAELNSHDEAQHIAEHNYLPEGVEQGIENLVRISMRAGRSTKKRKSEGEIQEGLRESKKPKAIPIRKANTKEKRVAKTASTTKTPKRKTSSTENAKPTKGEAPGERRRSGRVRLAGDKSYAERDDEEDDNEMEVLEWEYVNGSQPDDDELVEGQQETQEPNNHHLVSSSELSDPRLDPDPDPELQDSSPPSIKQKRSSPPKTAKQPTRGAKASQARSKPKPKPRTKRGPRKKNEKAVELNNDHDDADDDDEVSDPPDDEEE